MGPVELVVTDLDGTLWDAAGVVHPRTLDAVATLRRQGIHLLAATGRRRRSAHEVLARHDLTPPAVLLDGAVGHDPIDGATFFAHAFTPAEAATVLRLFRETGLSPCVYVDRPDADVVVDGRVSTHPRHLEAIGPWAVPGHPEQAVATEPVLAFGVAGRDPAVLNPLARRIEATGAAHATASRDVLFGGVTLMVRPLGCSKWVGTMAYCRRHGLDPDRVLAVGDGHNDVELLANAAVACVPADAAPEALAVADVVLPPTSEGGWADILEQLGGAVGHSAHRGTP